MLRWARRFVSGAGLALAAFPLLARADGPSAADIALAASGYDVVILGEVHDNPAHHEMQAVVAEQIAPSAFVFEMLDADEAGLIASEAAGNLDALADMLDWANSGWPDFTFYAPLFHQSALTATYGAEVSRDAAQQAFSTGAAEVFGTDAPRFGLDQPLPEDEQDAREAAQFSAHCDMLPPEILPGFVAAQRLRDAVLAQVALQALAETGGPVVVITGNGHARQDWGIPSVLMIAAPEVRVFSLGQVEGDLPEEAPFDLVASAPPVDRPDPCAAFR